MNAAQQLAQMESILEMRYQQRLQDFKHLKHRETHIRKALEKLKTHFNESSSEPLSHYEMRSIGADVAWHAWLGRKKASLNMELAQVLSIKEYHLKQVREAFGKLLVTQQMRKKLRTSSQQEMARNMLSRTIEFSTSQRQK
jgi:hypothetical protein